MQCPLLVAAFRSPPDLALPDLVGVTAAMQDPAVVVGTPAPGASPLAALTGTALRGWWSDRTAAPTFVARVDAIRTYASTLGPPRSGRPLRVLLEGCSRRTVDWRRWLTEPEGPEAAFELLLVAASDPVVWSAPGRPVLLPRALGWIRLWAEIDAASLERVGTTAIAEHLVARAASAQPPSAELARRGTAILRVLTALRPAPPPGLTRRGLPARARRDQTPAALRPRLDAWLTAIVDGLCAFPVAVAWPPDWLSLVRSWPGPWPDGAAVRLLTTDLARPKRHGASLLQDLPWTAEEATQLLARWPMATVRSALVRNRATVTMPVVAAAVLAAPGGSVKTLLEIHDRGGDRAVALAVLLRVLARDRAEALQRLRTHAHWSDPVGAPWPPALLRALLRHPERDVRLLAVRAMGRPTPPEGSEAGTAVTERLEAGDA